MEHVPIKSFFSRWIAVSLSEAGEGETILDDPKLFNALQFHVHTGSEHTVTGMRPDIEFHFVPQNLPFEDFTQLLRFTKLTMALMAFLE